MGFGLSNPYIHRDIYSFLYYYYPYHHLGPPPAARMRKCKGRDPFAPWNTTHFRKLYLGVTPEVQEAIRLPKTLKVWNVVFILFSSSSENLAQGFWETLTGL